MGKKEPTMSNNWALVKYHMPLIWQHDKVIKRDLVGMFQLPIAI